MCQQGFEPCLPTPTTYLRFATLSLTGRYSEGMEQLGADMTSSFPLQGTTYPTITVSYMEMPYRGRIFARQHRSHLMQCLTVASYQSTLEAGGRCG
jgi:hypothetical protein